MHCEIMHNKHAQCSAEAKEISSEKTVLGERIISVGSCNEMIVEPDPKQSKRILDPFRDKNVIL